MRKMSRLDRFEEILNSYEGRKPSEQKKIILSISDIKNELSLGHEDDHRIGFLIGEMEIKDHEVVGIPQIIVPEQDSDLLMTTVQESWAQIMAKAKSLGSIAGTVIYTGSQSIFFSENAVHTHEKLSQLYKFPDFILALNKKGECLYRRNGEIVKPGDPF
jgi:hypothetical protein